MKQNNRFYTTVVPNHPYLTGSSLCLSWYRILCSVV